LCYEIFELFKSIDGKGLIKKFNQILSTVTNPDDLAKGIYECVDKGSKAEFALELLYLNDPQKLNVPRYISEGLEWLQEKLKKKLSETFVEEINQILENPVTV